MNENPVRFGVMKYIINDFSRAGFLLFCIYDSIVDVAIFSDRSGIELLFDFIELFLIYILCHTMASVRNCVTYCRATETIDT